MKKTSMLLSIFILYYINTYSQSNRYGSEKIQIKFNAQKGIADQYPSYEVKQNGYIVFEVEDINLFRYAVTLTEIQNNVINSTKLSEGNTQININPTIFNLSDLNLNIQIGPIVTTNQRTTALVNFEKVINDNKREMESTLLDIEKNNTTYLAKKERIDKINELKIKSLQFNSSINYLKGLDKSDITQPQKQEIIDLEKNERDNQNELNTILQISSYDADNLYVTNYEINIRQPLQNKLDSLKSILANFELQYKQNILNDSTNNSRFKNFNTAIEEYNISLSKINELSDFYQRLINILYSDQSFAEIDLEKQKAARDIFQMNEINRDDILKYCYKRLRDIESKFNKLSTAYKYILDVAELDEIKAKKAGEIYDKISTFNSLIKINAYSSFFLQIAKIYDAINISNFTLKYQTLILTDNADLIKYNFKAEPHSNLLSSIETRPIEFKYDVRIIGGVKIDISTGVFWNIGLNDETYRFERESDNTSLVIKEKNENLFIPSIGVLFNIYKRSNKDIKLGGNIGFSTNTEKINYYLGASLLVGKSERINLNFGLAGAQVKRVSDLYDTDKSIPVPFTDLPSDVPLRNPSPFKIGAYFGITFNLLGTKNNETLSQISKL